MSPASPPSSASPPQIRACPPCACRAPLLAALGVRLDFRARDLTRFWDLLALEDEQLIDAVGGRRRTELHSAYAAIRRQASVSKAPLQSICRHAQSYPARLCDDPLAPRALYVSGHAERAMMPLGGAVVAIVGARHATDYGMETARTLARELAGCGISVVSAFAEGIAHAAHVGALEAQGATVTVMGGGVERCSPACCAKLYRQLKARASVISELVPNARPRVWSQLARARTLALLADLLIVVEARESPHELACATLARALGRTVAAVPGRVSSPPSGGTNLLIQQGAALVRGSQDALDLIYGVGVHAAVPPAPREPQLAAVLEKVAEGHDTLAKLMTSGRREADLALALSELELRGLLVRGDGGRYVAQLSPSPDAPDRVPTMPGANLL